MALTINILWENKNYWIMYKYIWSNEINLENITQITLKTPLEQAKKTIIFIWKWLLRIKDLLTHKRKRRVIKRRNLKRNYRSMEKQTPQFEKNVLL